LLHRFRIEIRAMEATGTTADANSVAVKDLIRHTRELVSAEVALARDELGTELRRARRGVTLLLCGVAAVQCGVLLLALTLPAALGATRTETMWLAFVVLAVGVSVALAGRHLMLRPFFVRTRERLGTIPDSEHS
jgi:hypothetical protein